MQQQRAVYTSVVDSITPIFLQTFPFLYLACPSASNNKVQSRPAGIQSRKFGFFFLSCAPLPPTDGLVSYISEVSSVRRRFLSSGKTWVRIHWDAPWELSLEN